MKKILILGVTVLFMMTACSDDDTTTTPANDNTLLQKTITTSEDGTVTTSNYTYSDNKIVSIVSSDGTTSSYIYIDDLITNIKTTKNNNINEETIIEYNSDGRKKSEISLLSAPGLGLNQGTKELYTYNQDGTITYSTYSGDTTSQTQFEGTGKITIDVNNGLILHQGMNMEDFEHKFDTNKNPMKNIKGFEEYMMPHFNGTNNLLEGFKTTSTISYINTYTYNSDKYPLTLTEKTFVGGKYITSQKQYFY